MKMGPVFPAGLVFLVILMTTAVPELVAQERPPYPRDQERRIQEADLPRWVEEDVIRFFNDPSTIRFNGRSRIPSTRVIVGDVAALGGPLTLAGEVDGDLMMVNGDLIFASGGTVTGDVLIVGGRVLGGDLGDIGGDLRVFEEPLRYVRRGDRIRPARRDPDEDPWFSPRFGWGDARFTVKAGQNYNRIEGLPVVFGPSFRTAGPNPLKADFFAIWRTDYGLELGEEDFGWALRGEQTFGGRGQVGLGGSFYSRVDPIEDWGISNLEASLATFILHKDYRDYYEREGWSVFGRLSFPFYPIELRAEYFQEDHRFASVSSPWSLTKNNEPWREQPLVAEGDLRFVEAALTLDTRNYRDDPTDGWHIQAVGRKGLGGELYLPEHRAAPETQAAIIEAEEYETNFLSGFLDIRSYNRVGPRSSLNLRGIMGGSLNDVPLPPQYQHALGGVGSLPGQRLFAGDCGARTTLRRYDVEVDEDVTAREAVFPAYGCDQFALFQAEFRGSLFVDWSFGWDDEEDDWDEDWSWYPSIELSPDWATFFNMGRGWSVLEEGSDTDTLMDVGVGLYLGDLGVYFAYPLNEDRNGDREGQFFIRLSRRF